MPDSNVFKTADAQTLKRYRQYADREIKESKNK